MNELLIRAILAATNSDGDDAIWMQMLVLVILVAFFGIVSLIKTKSNKVRKHQQDYPEYGPCGAAQKRWRWQIQPLRRDIAQRKAVAQQSLAKTQNAGVHSSKPPKEPMLDFGASDMAKTDKDVQSGMELLGLDFLLSIVENTEGDDQNNVTMRKLNFDELVHRKQLHTVDSSALKVYATDASNLYGKAIQCEAMKQLAQRTAHRGKRNS